MLPPSEHLLRTLAAVPPRSRVLDLGCGRGRHAGPLAQLGFDLHACGADAPAVAAARDHVAETLGPDEAERRVTTAPRLASLGYPDAYFDWIVAYDALGGAVSREALLALLAEARRVLKAGGWIYVTAPAVPEDLNPNDAAAGYASDSGLPFAFTSETLRRLMDEADLAEAEAPQRIEEDGGPRLRAIYRRVEADTPP